MGNYVACKKYKKKRQSGFINFTSTHLELTAKTYVAIGTGTLDCRAPMVGTSPVGNPGSTTDI